MAQWRAFVVMLAPDPIDAPNQRDALAVARAKFGTAAVIRVQSVASLRAAAAEPQCQDVRLNGAMGDDRSVSPLGRSSTSEAGA
jgi:hypothetical protein